MLLNDIEICLFSYAGFEESGNYNPVDLKILVGF